MINFMKLKRFYFIFSLLFLIPSAYFLIFHGLKPAIDFTGGTLLEVNIEPSQSQQDSSLTGTVPVTVTSVEEVAGEIVDLYSLQTTGDNSFIIRAQEFDQAKNIELQQALSTALGEVQEISFSTLGPTLGKELIRKTLTGVALAAGFILVFVTMRFKDKKYGVCAILAMLHDTFILIGVFAFLGVVRGVEVDALFVTAVLTILSFSVHDTIVVYDRIRESQSLYPKLSYTDLINKSVTETLGRSVNNSLTIIFMLLALYLLGGETIKWFVFALLIGTISGTYSSTFTAAPLLVLWEEIKSRKK
jgi:preprotein translocase subunit SecF